MAEQAAALFTVDMEVWVCHSPAPGEVQRRAQGQPEMPEDPDLRSLVARLDLDTLP